MFIRKVFAAALLAAGSLAWSNEPTIVSERFFTGMDEANNVDSIAIWHSPDRGERWLIATSKAGHQLFVYDAQNGFPIKRIGEPGSQLGQFQRPNGIAIIDNIALVVERDNHRVQVLRLPSFEPVGAFGSQELIKPYGIYARKTANNSYQVYVSDDYNTSQTEEPDPEPNPGGIRKRVKRFRLELAESSLRAELLSAFGSHCGSASLDVVESLYGDERHNRLLVADEDEEEGLEIHVFDLEGKDTGKRIGKGTFQFQPEGIALWQTSESEGYWILTDQGKEANHYHLYDRETLAFRVSFQGIRTLNTDGVAIDLEPSPRYPKGLFYGIHDDSGVSAWSLADLEAALGL